MNKIDPQIKVMSPKEFSLLIEKNVKKYKTPYLESIVDYCEKNNIEIETIVKLLNSNIKEKIAVEASKLNLIKEKTPYLPITPQ